MLFNTMTKKWLMKAIFRKRNPVEDGPRLTWVIFEEFR